MHTLAFYLFAILTVLGGVLLISFRNPVSSALSMVLSFVGLAGLFIGLNAYFVGIVQILVYAGAIMVLFVFIIMLLDLNVEKPNKVKCSTILAGVVVPLLLVCQVLGVIQSNDGNVDFAVIDTESMQASAQAFPTDSAIYESLSHPTSPKLPDTNLIGQSIFTSYNFPLQIMGALLLVATIGVVVLSKRNSKQSTSDS